MVELKKALFDDAPQSKMKEVRASELLRTLTVAFVSARTTILPLLTFLSLVFGTSVLVWIHDSLFSTLVGEEHH